MLSGLRAEGHRDTDRRAGMNKGASEKLCRAMLFLLQKEKLEDITVKQLVAEAGVSRSSYNYNYGSLTQVVDAVISDFTDGFLEVMDKVYRTSEPDEWSEESLYTGMFNYVYENRDTLRVLKNAGFLETMEARMIRSLENYFGRWTYRYAAMDGTTGVLEDGMVYNLKNLENASRIVADFTFWMRNDYILPAEFMTNITDRARRIRLTGIETTKY